MFNESAVSKVNVMLKKEHYAAVKNDVKFLGPHGNGCLNLQKIRKNEGCDDKRYRKPVLVLKFLSEKFASKITRVKYRLKSKDLFNVSFKSGVKLGEVAKRVNEKLSKKCRITEKNGKFPIKNEDKLVDFIDNS